ncbi:hypothetical protein AX14_013896 [Amanita brunnescens Koide BX004]|nr:hypothetical protein AX14_013896 [Amanita brunnescens Koide BX004]
MKDLLIGPWQRSANDRRPERPPYLVIDALDEIEGEGWSFLIVLTRHLRIKPDIVTYLKHRLPYLRGEPRLTDLAQKADGLFLYAATVVRYITPRPKMPKGLHLH